ncbi:hypothetical protein GSI_03054 [Ganoderma sinense ZZ0214-1]|uniref:Uncharacterized protein n=1 Tax=Ganoderma sinense ZZ0214-1 TaxID=1077348 RepID=A0A2G8SKJ4_9APHY|nr:hypothetical protein GSI_03054 [Ganoderma sinense ZZ0214-1]
MSVADKTTAGSPQVLFAPADGKAYKPEDRDLVFSQQPLHMLQTYLLPCPTSRLKPPELQYGWRIGREKFMDLIRIHFPDGITCSLGPEVDEEDPDLCIPPEEYDRPYPDTHATLFGAALIDSILKYLGLPDADQNIRSLLKVDYLSDNHGRAEVGLVVGSTYLGDVLEEPHYSKLKALISPNEDAMWYLSFDNWRWRRQVPKQVSKRKSKKSATKATQGTVTVS